MTYHSISLITIITWAVLLAVYYVGRSRVKSRYLKDAPIIHNIDASDPRNNPGSPWSKIGTLFVFSANTATFTLVFIAAISPAPYHYLSWVGVSLPLWVNILGNILFVLNAVWGLLASTFGQLAAFQTMTGLLAVVVFLYWSLVQTRLEDCRLITLFGYQSWSYIMAVPYYVPRLTTGYSEKKP